MKKYIILSLLFLIIVDLHGQFRRRKKASEPSENLLNYSNPTKYIIAEINVTGLKFLDETAIISLSGLKVGDEITIPGTEITTAIKKIWKYGLVGDVEISINKIQEEKIYLDIELTERPRLTEINFEGVTKGKEAELREDLNVVRGRILTDAIIKNIELTTKKFYTSKGFLNTVVKVVKINDTLNTDGIRLNIIVEPYAKIKVNKIYFTGNDLISSNKLKSKMKSTNEHVRISLFRKVAELIYRFKSRSLVNFFTKNYQVTGKEFKQFINDNVKLNFFKSSKFVQSEFETDKPSLIDYYNSKGFRDATILVDSTLMHDEKTIDIYISVAEGKKYYFRDIIWTGNYVHEDKVLDDVLAIKKGDVYNRELIDNKLSFNPKGPDISGLYMDDGYLFFRVNPVEVKIEGDSIDIDMRIYEGEQATIKNVIIKGNDKTRDHVVRRELTTIPGKKFARYDIIQSQQRLSQLGFFDPELISPTPLPNPANGTVDIEWDLVEKSNDQIQLSGGWGGQFGFIGSVGLTLNNFSLNRLVKGKLSEFPVGDGQQLSITGQANARLFRSYSIMFNEPWLGGKKPNSFGISYNNSVQRTRSGTDLDGDGLANKNGEIGGFYDYDGSLKLNNISLSLGRRLEWPDNYFILRNSVSYLVYKLENYGSRGLGYSNGTSRSITFNTTFSRESVDNPNYPTGGSSISLSLALTPPWSAFKSDNFWELDANDIDDVKQYIDNKYTKVENVFGQLIDSSIPFSERDPENFENRVRQETIERTNRQKYSFLEYHKWMFDARFYTKLIGKMVLETRAHFGFIGSYSSNLGAGPFERFTMGGDGLSGQNFLLGTDVIGLRGYENNSITPPRYATNNSFTSSEINGGIIYNKYVAELRYPVTTSQTATIYGFVFAEAGNNWDNYANVNLFNVYRSAGFGVKLLMPAFGLIGLHWGYGFDTLPGRSEKSGAQFHFTFGQQIR